MFGSATCYGTYRDFITEINASEHTVTVACDICRFVCLGKYRAPTDIAFVTALCSVTKQYSTHQMCDRCISYISNTYKKCYICGCYISCISPENL